MTVRDIGRAAPGRLSDRTTVVAALSGAPRRSN
jgi:hypothetical protein